MLAIRVKSTSSTNMADTKFLPVDASARQQHNRRALTAHSNFMVNNLAFTKSSNRRDVSYDVLNLLPPLLANFLTRCNSRMFHSRSGGRPLVAPHAHALISTYT